MGEIKPEKRKGRTRSGPHGESPADAQRLVPCYRRRLRYDNSMSSDRTQYQSPEEQHRAQRLSLQNLKPPGETPGYELQRFLGSGAYGEVWIGIDRNTGRRVAVKFYLHRGGLDWTLLSREVEKLVFLSADRYVVQLLDVGWDAEPPYYVMEYVENGSLEQLLEHRERLPASESVEMFREIAVGLAHAHGKGVLHCDLKPANLLLDQDHRPRLADFGQSRLSHEQTPALGTLFYMAPEQADLDAVPDVRWDVYALGAILYRMLTGSPPHRDEEVVRQIEQASSLDERLARYRQVIEESPLPIEHRMRSDVDKPLADIVDQCLAPDPDQRYANVHAVLDALHARDQSRSRRPLLVLGLAGPVLLLAIMTLTYWFSFGAAVERSRNVIYERTYRSNEFAAKFVAKSCEAELADYFDLSEQESQRADLQALFQTAAASETLQKLNDPETPEEQLETLRESYFAEEDRQRLSEYLKQRLHEYNFHGDHDGPQFASIFILDRWGTIVAVALSEDLESTSIGKNFAWRNYFHGGSKDREKVRPEQLPEVIDRTHLSAAYKSSTVGKWRVAVSTPIKDPSSPDGPVLGVISLTINVGDFPVFRSQKEQTDYFAVLIDVRDGDRKGTVLQHPLFRQQAPTEDYQLASEQLTRILNRQVLDYRDPLAAAPGGAPYQGHWIAAAERVPLPARGRDSADATDLLVLVQVNAAATSSPINDLGRRLAINAAWALIGIVAVVTILWFIVYRTLGDRRPVRLGRRLIADEPEPLPTMPTIPVSRGKT